MRVLLALGGNAMTAPDGSARPEDQIAAAKVAMESVADLIAAGHEVVITHGNGPQVGNLLVKNELAASVVPPVPLDWCGAQTQATLGFILMNALEAAGENPPGRLVEVDARAVDGHGVVIEVADSGPGLPQPPARIFDAFYTTKPSGMGMGLSIVRTIIDSHGGSIEADNGPDGGAVVCVRLPLAVGGPA